MSEAVNQQPNPGTGRREILAGGLFLGAAILLPGCAGGSRSAANIPGPVWPDKEPWRPESSPTPTVQTPPRGPVIVANDVPPGILPRSAWTSSQPNMRVAKPMNGVRRITIHHDAQNSTGLSGQRAVANRIAAIRNDHVRRKDPSTGAGWVDIGYHYIIDPDGRIWAARPTNIEGAHVRETNQHNLGIMVLGNFDQHRPTSRALQSLNAFVVSQMRTHRVPVSQVYTHQELKSSACPGRNLQSHMRVARASGGPIAAA